jgi:hypothetical protein
MINVQPECSWTFVTHSFLDPRYTGAWGCLHAKQPAYIRTQRFRNSRHRHYLASHYVLWFASSGLPLSRRVWTGTPLVEAGGLLCFSLAVVFFAYMVTRIHKGAIWLLIATIAEVVPAVSGLTHIPLLFAYRDIMSQVFLCLNLNSRLLFYLFCQRKITDCTRFSSKYQFRSTPCVLIFYSCG